MPQVVTDVEILRQYVAGVMERADHHAANVNEVVLTIAGALIWKKDADPVEVFAREGDMKNVLWVRIGGTRYALSYNHEVGTIEMREGSTRGRVVRSFTNADSAAVIKSFFDGL